MVSEIVIQRGNFLSVKEGIIVHGCNCQGKMRSGVASEIRDLYPEAYNKYKTVYDTNGLRLGSIIPVDVSDTLTIINAMTQEYYGRDKAVVYVSYDAVYECFEQINVLALQMNRSVHFPLIGCGLGNGDWNIVSQIINDTLDSKIQKTLWVLPNK